MKSKGDGRRISRMESEVQRLVSQYLIGHMKGEFPGIITISRVQMPADLRSARVYLSVLNLEGKFSDLIETLQRRAAEIQRYIGDHLHTRYCPKITFYEDEVTHKVLKIEGILKSLSPQETKIDKEIKK